MGCLLIEADLGECVKNWDSFKLEMSHVVERFLSAVAASVENQAAGESVIGTIKIAVLPIAKVFTMCFLGFLMASKYVNILPASGRKLLNGVMKPTPFSSSDSLSILVIMDCF